jgi:hypothetical protein
MPEDVTPLALPPPAPPDRRTTLRVILALSAVLHLGVLAFAARATHAPEVAARSPRGTVTVLRGEVTTDPSQGSEPGLRLLGYAEVAAPVPAKR